MNKLITLVLCLISQAAMAVDYPVAFLAHPRTTGWFRTQSVSQNSGPYVHFPGTDLILMQPDGTERVLVHGLDAAKRLVAVHDFVVDLDAKSIIYSHIRSHADSYGLYCDLFRIVIETGEITQLTDARNEWNPPRGAMLFSETAPLNVTEYQNNRTRKGEEFATVWNIGPCVVGDGSIIFSSNRNGVWPPMDHNGPSFQLFRMSADGRHVHMIGHMNLAGALHPSVTQSGRIWFASMEQQGGRVTNGNGWAIWSMNPDGSVWEPEVSAIVNPNPHHWVTETTDGTLVNAQYYDTRVYGALRAAPLFIPTPFGPPTKFGHPIDNPKLIDGNSSGERFGFQRRGYYNPVQWTIVTDRESVSADGELVGMVSHPTAIPNNGVMMTWTGIEGVLLMDLGVYITPDIKTVLTHPNQLTLVVDRHDRHEWLARPIVTFREIYGIDAPPVPLGATATDLPPGSPFAVVSTSSMAWPEIVLPSFKRGVFDNFTLEEAQYLRIVGFNMTANYQGRQFYRSGGGGRTNDQGFSAGGLPGVNERMTSYGEIPLWKYRKTDGGVHYGPDPPAGSTAILDPEGKPDTSFRVQIPANQPWTFQVLNAAGEAVSTAQTWHQLIPGEFRTCGGCHTHHGKVPFQWEESFAATPEYETRRLEAVTLKTWTRDVKPIVDKYSLPLTKHLLDSLIQPFNSDDTAVDNDPRLTDEEAKTIRTWIDLGGISEGQLKDYRTQNVAIEREITEADRIGPFADTQQPTVSHAVFADRIVIGLHDPQAGIDLATFSVKCSGALAGVPAGGELAQLFSHDAAEHIWTLTTPVPEDADLTISVRDKQTGVTLYGETFGVGNLTKVTIPLKHKEDIPEEPVDPNAERIAQILDSIEDLKDQIDELEAELTILQGGG